MDVGSTGEREARLMPRFGLRTERTVQLFVQLAGYGGRGEDSVSNVKELLDICTGRPWEESGAGVNTLVLKRPK